MFDVARSSSILEVPVSQLELTHNVVRPQLQYTTCLQLGDELVSSCFALESRGVDKQYNFAMRPCGVDKQ